MDLIKIHFWFPILSLRYFPASFPKPPVPWFTLRGNKIPASLSAPEVQEPLDAQYISADLVVS